VLTKEAVRNADDLDIAAIAAGGYINTNAGTVSYRIQAMHNYCISQDKDIEKLSPTEREMFRVTATPKAL